MKNKIKKFKIRKTLRRTYIIIFLAIAFLSLYFLYDSFNSENKKNMVKSNIYEYKNKYSYTYDVNMLENEYIEKDNIGEENVYITSLMDNANINMKYLYTANQSSDITYNYQIVGYLEAIYMKDDKEQKVWKESDIIVPARDLQVTSDTFEINEEFSINIKDKIQRIKDFQEELGMQVQTKYIVYLGVTTNTQIMGKTVTNVYSPDIIFDIGTKTTTVSTSVEETYKPEVVTRMVQESDDMVQIKKSIATITLIVSALGILFIIVKTANTNTVKNEYKVELNRIIKGCSEKLVEVNSRIDTEGQSIVDVKEFDEVLKVSEELFKPILYWNNEDEEETWFCVLGNNIVYRYILKR